MTVTINGKKLELQEPTTLIEYLRSRGLADRQIAVAVNGTVVRKEDFGGITLRDGDQLEIVRPVGGGQT
ncbi:MAG: sulfur carrier protein ThiS [Chloroflexi bacterium]|nr:sulfur carrier protein ThiS [Chloroflexota bacterium]